MSAREDRRVDQARRRLAGSLEQNSRLLPGSLVERMMRCGKANCRCRAEPPQLHGPYVQWGYTRGRKRLTRWLSAEQLERYRPRIDSSRRLRELISELEELEVTSVERAEGWGT